MDFVTLAALPACDVARLKNSAKIADALEARWMRKVSSAIETFIPDVIKKLERSGKAQAPDLTDLFCDHFFDVSIRAMRYAQRESEIHDPLPKNTRQMGQNLAAPPKQPIPKSLRDLMKMYDLYRRKKFKPKRAVQQAKEIQAEYLKKVQSVWEKHSRDFRSGDVASQQVVIKKVKEAAGTTVSRAKNIVRTETTNYYNKARKQFYDQSEDITHYLFVAIRDAATSPWCTPLTVAGYRGRSGLVYAKSDPLCDRERPACHPGCRSEFLPLNRLNPAHLRYIQNLSIQRRNHKCYPLLNGWRPA